MTAHSTSITVPHISALKSRRAALLGLVAALGLGAVVAPQLIDANTQPNLPARSTEVGSNQFLDPAELAFIGGAGSVTAAAPMFDAVELDFITNGPRAAVSSAPMLDPVEVDFITGGGTVAEAHGCYSTGPC